MKTWAFVSLKGGSGRSALTALFASALARSGKSVLAIDLCESASLTYLLAGDIGSDYRGSDQLFLSAQLDLRRLTAPTREAKLRIIPATPGLALLDRIALTRPNLALNFALSLSNQQSGYEYILIDTPASRCILTASAISVADATVTPTSTTHLTAIQLAPTLEFIGTVAAAMRPSRPLTPTVLLNMVSPNGASLWVEQSKGALPHHRRPPFWIPKDKALADSDYLNSQAWRSGITPLAVKALQAAEWITPGVFGHQ